jgi:sensor histidine kinase regulating citrate/malate metabolism
VAIKCQFATVSAFKEGLAAVNSAGEWGYIDKAGQLVIKPEFNSAYEFSGGIAEVS